MPTSPTPKECLNPPVTIAVVGVEKKPDKQFPVVVKGFPINWEDKI
jgi:predicted CoA-binding protein